MKNQNEKKKINPILWFLFAIVIPLIIVLVIVAVILNFTGFNVLEWSKEKGSEIPVVSNFIPDEEELTLEMEIENLKEELELKNDELEQMETQIEDLEMEILQLEQEIDSQEEIIAQYESEEVEKEESIESGNKAIKDLATTFSEMKPARAADILSEMNEREIVLILNDLPNDVRGEILQAMETELAAKIASQLLE